MISKLVAWAEDRPAAIARMRRALGEYVVAGIKTTVPFFTLAARRSPSFVAGRFHTTYLDEVLTDAQRPAVRRADAGGRGRRRDRRGAAGACCRRPTLGVGCGRTARRRRPAPLEGAGARRRAALTCSTTSRSTAALRQVDVQRAGRTVRGRTRRTAWTVDAARVDRHTLSLLIAESAVRLKAAPEPSSESQRAPVGSVRLQPDPE